MASQKHELMAFNRGLVSPLLLARADVPRLALSAETQTNFIPSTLGSMSLRPGLEYIGATRNNAAAKHIPFIYSKTDTAIIELTDYVMRVRVSEALISRPSVTTAVTNGGFDTDLTGWTDADEGGTAASTWLTGGYLSLLGDGTNAAKRTQAVSLGVGNAGTEHALSIHVARGPVTLRVGSSSGDDDYVTETKLETGYHSLAFTPSGTFHITVLSREEYPCLLNTINVAATGNMEITTPWPAAYLGRIRYAQSADVIWVACNGVRMQRIERRGARSWSVVDYAANEGPFRVENLTNATMTASALTGLITLTASVPTFKSTHVGALFKLTSNGQSVTQSAAADLSFTNSILVTGTGDTRAFGVTVTGTWSGTLTLQRSIGAEGDWQDVVTYTTNQSTALNDNLDNQIIYYRLGFKSGGYISGTAVLGLTCTAGSITGVVRVSAFTSSTQVTGFVLKDLGSISATTRWAEGAWSDYRGHPSAVALYEGRLWLVGLDKFWGSVVDDYANHDPDYIGDAGPVSRSIGEGPVDTMRWLLGSTNLLAGGDMAEFRARSSGQEEPITPTYFNVRAMTTLGSHDTDAELLDNGVVFVDRSGVRVQNLVPEGDRYTATDLTVVVPKVCSPGVADLAVQRQPDTRIHAVLDDGTVAALIFSKTEEVQAWIKIETAGDVEEVFVLPGDLEDAVYYVVKRTINAATVRYLEKWALATECEGGTVNKQADAFYYYSGAATTTITGLGHLEGESVVVWADGVDAGTFTVTAGVVTLTTAAAEVVVGLPYTAQFKSTRLAQTVSDMISRKRIAALGVILANTHAQGLQYGPDFSTLDDLPGVENGIAVDADGIWSSYNYDYFSFNGSYTNDSRLCLQAAAPRPCTVLAAVMRIDGS